MITNKLIAHRGWQNRYPENTLPAIDAALQAGARHIEIDVQLTADGIPVLCHDHVLQRICGSNKNINDSQFEQLKDLSAYEPERLGDQFLSTPLSPLIDCVELIKGYSQATLYVELKKQSIRKFGADKMLDAVLPLLEGIHQQCFLISFDSNVLHQAVHRGWNNIAPVLLSYQQVFTPEITKLSPPLIFCDYKLLDNEQALSQLPFPAAVYEIADYALAQSLLNQGAALIETFCIGELIALDLENTKDTKGKNTDGKN